jgi:UDP-N-acetylglucosamine 2-epimerase (non-hydrolysing)
MPFKVMTIVGTRPDLIKLSRVICELDRHTSHVLVHTGQNFDYELNGIFFQQLEIRTPDHVLNSVGSTTAETIGNVIARSDAVIAQERPDAVLILGDTNSSLSVIAAKRRKVPVFHMEAGNRSFDERVPEEINRRIVDHLSDINLPYTEHARRYLLNEGLRPERIIKTGSPIKEVLEHYRLKIEASDVLRQLNLTPGEYFVVSSHREENIESETNFADFQISVRSIAEKYQRPVIVSTHPRTRRRLEQLGIPNLHENVRFLKPLGFFEYVKLQMNALCVVSDSGTVTEESSVLDFPAVTIRQSHERPEGMDEGTLVMCGLTAENVLRSIDLVTSQRMPGRRAFRLVPDYDVDNVSQKIVRIVMSYTDYVNRTVWHKPTLREHC